ncbi:MAG: sensor signal transduction histidine kinase [Bryobacterales bacterium]|nr:sensor signal transduction histidine kinase [Bryobacterales bacterium]
MLQELKFQVSTAVLTVITIAAMVAAVLNFQQLHRFRMADDGVTWVDKKSASANEVTAYRVGKGGSGDKAGLRAGDVLVRINSTSVSKALEVPQILAGIGSWTGQQGYSVRRNGVEFTAKLIVGEAAHDSAVDFQYLVGSAYLAIGLFVYFRRGSAQKARHFFLFCLVSFIFSCFHYTGKLNNFDKVIYWGNVVAGWLAPTLFLHFCLTFPEPRRWFRPRLHGPLLYVPGIVFTLIFVGITSGVVRVNMPLVQLNWYLDRVWMALLTVLYLVSGLTLALEYRRTEDPILRQQLKWLRNGTFCGLLPFALFYAVPYIMGGVPGTYMRMTVLSLPLIPLTLAYAIVRYRLMDVDVIFRRGYAYTLATLCILAAFYAIVFTLGSLVQKNMKDLGNTGLVGVMLVTAFLFQPLRNWMQERLDKYFYRERYDYRLTLIEFARELNSEVDLDKMLASVADRLMQTLSIRQIGFFMSDGLPGGTYQLRRLVGSNGRRVNDIDPLDLSFLTWERTTPYLFFERTRYRLDVIAQSWPTTVRQTISDLDLTYYLPCTVRGRTIAFIGVSRTENGDFLSSDDLELLMTLSGYVGIAMENASLYRSLQRKVEDYERLKEFSENIVESINVGILAADLADRVESWNTRMEQLTGVPRESALGHRLADLLPASLMEQLERTRGDEGIHHLYKIVLPYSRRTDNREAVVNVAITPLVSREMEQIGRLVIFDDITERSELERRLVQADKLTSIGLLAAGVAHEVNTPLAVISTYAQMLAKQVADDEQKSRMLDKIAKQTFRASEIVNSLLNFSRTSSTEVAQINLNRVIQETLSLLEHPLKTAGIRVEARLDPLLMAIDGSFGKLQQVFTNLILNARDAMQPGGVLEIVTENDGKVVRVDVTDTGHGIAPEHLARIYDPFFTTKAARKGTGLGLSVTYGIVQEHGGTIEVFPNPAGGSRFRIELPVPKRIGVRIERLSRESVAGAAS